MNGIYMLSFSYCTSRWLFIVIHLHPSGWINSLELSAIAFPTCRDFRLWVDMLCFRIVWIAVVSGIFWPKEFPKHTNQGTMIQAYCSNSRNFQAWLKSLSGRAARLTRIVSGSECLISSQSENKKTFLPTSINIKHISWNIFWNWAAVWNPTKMKAFG